MTVNSVDSSLAPQVVEILLRDPDRRRECEDEVVLPRGHRAADAADL